LWPKIEGVPAPSTLVYWALGEAAFGLFAGVAVGWIAEIFTMGAQVLSVQTGYSFASTFDPNTQADSGILMIFGQLMAGLLFFATGLDQQLIRAFAMSLEACPPGTFLVSPSLATALIRLGGEVFALALRLALPIIGLLLFVDLVLGVLGRVNSQMQVISLSFPVKMVVSIVMLASLLTVFPLLYKTESARVLQVIGAAFLRK
jgi:flagellar biosynthetic protein FliR